MTNERLFSRAELVKILLCSALASCHVYFMNVFQLRRAVEADIYLALNLIVPAFLLFLTGLAIHAWANNNEDEFISPIKTAIAVSALIALSLISSAILTLYSGVGIQHPGSWLAFHPTLEHRAPRTNSIFGEWGFIVIASVLALAVIYWHRRISFGGQIEKRLVSICAIISAATVASVGLQLAFFGGNPRFMAVRNLGSIGLVDIYGFVLAFVSYRVLFSLLKNKDGQVVAPALSVMKKGGGKK